MNLNELKKQLDEGVVDESTKQHLKAVLDKSENINPKTAQTNLDQRIKESGEVEPISDSQERNKLKEAYDAKMEEMNKDEEAFRKIALIMNYESTIKEVREEYEKTLKTMEIQLEEMQDAFREEFGDPDEYINKHKLS